MPDFGMEFNVEEFDINAAFQGAIEDVATSTTLALDEKIQRMEFMVNEATSEFYRGFVDLRAMATQMEAQMEMMCRHNHGATESMRSNETLSGFVDTHKDNGPNHDDSDQDHQDDDGHENSKKGKKKKKRRFLFGVDF